MDKSKVAHFFNGPRFIYLSCMCSNSNRSDNKTILKRRSTECALFGHTAWKTIYITSNVIRQTEKQPRSGIN